MKDDEKKWKGYLGYIGILIVCLQLEACEKKEIKLTRWESVPDKFIRTYFKLREDEDIQNERPLVADSITITKRRFIYRHDIHLPTDSLERESFKQQGQESEISKIDSMHEWLNEFNLERNLDLTIFQVYRPDHSFFHSLDYPDSSVDEILLSCSGREGEKEVRYLLSLFIDGVLMVSKVNSIDESYVDRDIELLGHFKDYSVKNTLVKPRSRILVFFYSMLIIAGLLMSSILILAIIDKTRRSGREPILDKIMTSPSGAVIGVLYSFLSMFLLDTLSPSERPYGVTLSGVFSSIIGIYIVLLLRGKRLKKSVLFWAMFILFVSAITSGQILGEAWYYLWWNYVISTFSWDWLPGGLALVSMGLLSYCIFLLWQFLDKILINADPEIKQIANLKYPNDHNNRNKTYDEQLAAKDYMKTVADSGLKEIACREYPNDYSMQKQTYDQLLKKRGLI